MDVKKYIVTAELNIRKFAAKVSDHNLAGTLLPGFVIDAVDEVNGDLYLDSNIWLKDANGFYYWKGGVAEYTGPITPVLTIQQDYNQLLEDIPDNIKATKGKGVVIAVVDTGIYPHPGFKDRVLYYYDAVRKQESNNFRDDTGHGTIVSHLIGLHGNTSSIVGVASKARFIIVKASDNGSFFPVNLYNSLQWLVLDCPVKPHVINISFNCAFSASYDLDIKNILKIASDKGIAVIAAGQNNGSLFQENQNLFYPAWEQHVVAVGAIYVDIPESSKLIPQIKYVVPKDCFYMVNASTGLPECQQGASFAAAIISGIFALFKAYKSELGPNEIAVEINKSLEPYFSDILNETIKIYKNENFTL